MKADRIAMGFIATAVLFSVVAVDHYWAKGFFSAALLSVIAFTAALETCAVLEAAGMPAFKRSTALASFVVALVPAIAPRFWQNMSPFALQAGIIFGFMILTFVFSMRCEDLARGARGVAAGTFTLVYVGLALSFLVRVRHFGKFGEPLLLFAIGCAKLGDVGAYFVGKTVGRHALAARLSPKKTIEGAFGGLLGSVVAALIMWPYVKAQVSLATFVVWSLVLGAAAQLGDLAESVLKRAGAVKDSSPAFGTMGGVLDLVDSLLLSAPVAYILALSGGFGAFRE